MTIQKAVQANYDTDPDHQAGSPVSLGGPVLCSCGWKNSTAGGSQDPYQQWCDHVLHETPRPTEPGYGSTVVEIRNGMLWANQSHMPGGTWRGGNGHAGSWEVLCRSDLALISIEPA